MALFNTHYPSPWAHLDNDLPLEEPGLDLYGLFFELEGRIDRTAWILGSIAWFGMIATATILAYAFAGAFGANLMGLCLAGPFGWMRLSLDVKRWHDLGRSGWWVLVGLVPGGSLVQAVVHAFVPGVPTKG